MLIDQVQTSQRQYTSLSRESDNTSLQLLSVSNVDSVPYITVATFHERLELHKKWLNGDSDGVRARFGGDDLKKLLFTQNLNLRNADFSGADCSGLRFNQDDLGGRSEANKKCDMTGADFSGSNCIKTEFGGSILNQTKFIDSNCSNAIFDGCELIKTDFTGATCIKTSFKKAIMNHAILKNVNCSNANFYKTTLHKATLNDVNVDGATFWRTDLNSSSMENINFSDFLKFIEVKLQHSRFKDIKFNECEIIDADYTGSSFENIEFINTKLGHSIFTQSTLGNVSFYGADIRGVTGTGVRIYVGKPTRKRKIGVTQWCGISRHQKRAMLAPESKERINNIPSLQVCALKGLKV